MSLPIPFNSPFMFLTFSRYVRFIFHVCPVLALRVISLHLPSCRLVSLCFVSLSFPRHSPCFHFCPFHVPFSSSLFPFHFPLLSCHVDFLFPPLISLHFLALSSLLPSISRKKKRSFQRFRKEEFFQIFGKRRQEAQASKRAGRGNRDWDPCFATAAPRRLRLVERQIAARYVAPPPPRIRRRAGGGGNVRLRIINGESIHKKTKLFTPLKAKGGDNAQKFL